MKKLFLLLLFGFTISSEAAITTNRLLSAQVVTNLINSSISNAFGTNMQFSTWHWVDVTANGFSIGSNPGADPPVFTEIPGSNYFGYAYYFDDKGYFEIQGKHNFARTNAFNGTNIYFNPHMHVMVTNITAGSNATFRLDLMYSSVWGRFTNYYIKTNFCSFTNTHQHGVIDFGYVTNNSLAGRASVIFKGRIMRIDGGTGGVGANSPVWVDSFDIHMPVDTFGSGSVWGD